MRPSRSARTALSSVLASLILPLAVLVLVVVQTLVLAAPAQTRTASSHAGAATPRLHVPATEQQASVGSRECEQSGASVSSAPRGRDRHRAGVHAPFSQTAVRPLSTAESSRDHLQAGPSPLPRRVRPHTTPTQADLQVFRC
ncbi:hypothetical protein ACE14D_17685 [Streptomyces sp. Act-28]